jgi:hypothetical protein
VGPREVVNVKGCTHDLFLAVLRARNEVYGFHVSNVDLVTKDIREDDLGYISVLWNPLALDAEGGRISYHTFSSDNHPSSHLEGNL